MNVKRLKNGVFYIDLGVTDWSNVVLRLGEAWPLVAQGVEEVHPSQTRLGMGPASRVRPVRKRDNFSPALACHGFTPVPPNVRGI
jgi:hypothetical protein